MKRLLLVLGPVLSIAGASGLAVYGNAIVGVLDGVMTYRVVNPPEPLPASLGELGWVAFSGMALAFGLVISCVATAMRDSQRTISVAGKILQVVAGALLLIGPMPVLWGIVVAKRGFIIIATSAATPNPEDFREMVQSAAPTLTVGCVILVAGAVILLVAGQAGFRTKPLQTTDTRSMFGVAVAVGSVVLGVVLSILFVGIWLHGSALATMFADAASIMPKPWELAQHLVGILNKSLLVFIGVGCQGIIQILAAVFAPSSSSQAVSESLT